MALQTIILRPNGQTGGSNLSQFTRIPSDTTDANLYALINEAIADDDATQIAGTAISTLEISLPKELLSGITPIAVRVVARIKSEGILWSAKFATDSYAASGERVQSETKAANENMDVWETITTGIDNFDAVKTLLADESTVFRIGFSYPSGSSKTGKCHLTQLYLEVDYDDEGGGDEPVETPALYIKKSGAWEAVYGTVYNKVNGAWVEGDLSALSAGDNIIVEEQ